MSGLVTFTSRPATSTMVYGLAIRAEVTGIPGCRASFILGSHAWGDIRTPVPYPDRQGARLRRRSVRRRHDAGSGRTSPMVLAEIIGWDMVIVLGDRRPALRRRQAPQARPFAGLGQGRVREGPEGRRQGARARTPRPSRPRRSRPWPPLPPPSCRPRPRSPRPRPVAAEAEAAAAKAKAEAARSGRRGQQDRRLTVRPAGTRPSRRRAGARSRRAGAFSPGSVACGSRPATAGDPSARVARFGASSISAMARTRRSGRSTAAPRRR